MKKMKSLNKRRLGVVVNLLSLASVVSIFEYGVIEQWNTFLKISGFTAIIIFIVSLVATFIKTGLWKFTHKPLRNLDEREIALTSKSLRYAYSIFTITVLILLLSFSIIEKPVNIVLVVALILFAHLLPSAVIAWTEKQTENE